MPLPKRVVEPIHISRGTVPDSNEISLPSELETVTNGSLANTIRQLSSLSRHAEDLFGELAREAHMLATRANSLQARLDKLAVKTTQLDSTVEEVSLQEIQMRKAYKSSGKFDQQVVSRDTMPTAMLETYNQCDKPPPLNKLNPYREDDKDGMKFYTDPDYFFQLWSQEMLKDTERMMIDKGKKPHKPRSADNSGGRSKKRVRQPHNTRERQKQNAMKHGEYIMANSETVYAPSSVQPHYEYDEDSAISSLSTDQRPSRPSSIEIQRNYSQHVVDGGNKGVIYSPTSTQRYSPTSIYQRTQYGTGMAYYDDASHYQQQYIINQSQQQVISPSATNGHVMSGGMMSPNDALSPSGTPTRGNKVRPSQPPPAPPSATNSSSSTPSANTPTRGRSMSSGRETLPPPPPPPVETCVSATPPVDLPPPPPAMSQSPPSNGIPPPPPPPPPLPHATNGMSPILTNGDVGKSPIKPIVTTSPPNLVASPKQVMNAENNIMHNANANPARINNPKLNGPQYDPRSDLLKAIRDGIKLRKVEKTEQKDSERVNTLHDVASILARRVAVEISDSEDESDDSEYDDDGWAEQGETAVH
ncbi:actin-binding protein WASF3 [Planococcus citri]|uniref:actin-binding protein WASF3 n=1 Tax=Planococcus citri TaxID=170843 RepID=UPI0031F97D4C